MKPKMKVMMILLMGMMVLANGAPFQVIDSPETRLFQSLTPSEQMAIMRMALISEKAGGALIDDEAAKGHFVAGRMQSPEVLNLALKIRHWLKSFWQLTPDQVEEIEETGKLCNIYGQCIDFGGDWGNNCCPFG